VSEAEKDPIEQAVELLLYAPVGLLYEYQNVVPQLVKRGKSQVQLARLIGKMAMDRQTGGVDESIERAVEGAIGIAAQAITDFGAAIGLAPTEDDAGHSSAKTPAANDAIEADLASESKKSTTKPVTSKAVSEKKNQLPIARYDELKAKEIIPLLADLKPAQRERIAAHERSNRARKTILAKIDGSG